MAQQQGQDALADAAEANDHEAAGEGDMLLYRAWRANSRAKKRRSATGMGPCHSQRPDASGRADAAARGAGRRMLANRHLLATRERIAITATRIVCRRFRGKARRERQAGWVKR